MPDLTVIVCARDEADRIGATVCALLATFEGARVVVADDGSADATGAIARDAGAEVVRTPGIGKGGAATRAAEHVAGAELVLLCDADLGASAARLAPLVEAVSAGEADLAVAVFSHRVGGGFGIAVTSARRILRRLTGLELQAPISGQRALSGPALAAVTPFAPRFGMEIGMTTDAHRAGLRILELPLELEHRATGRSLVGFAHRGRQLADFMAVWWSRRRA